MFIENGESVFGTRENMDLSTSSGRAQRIFDELRETSLKFGGIPVSFTSETSPSEGKKPQVKSSSEKPHNGNGIKPNRLRQQDNQNGLTGFWRGSYYVRGKRRV